MEKISEYKRIKWIDCAKAVAMMAVVVDHTSGWLYTRTSIAQASFFSVSLFVLLAGISVKIAASRKKRTFMGQVKKVLSFYVQYAIATLILLIFYQHFFDVSTYISSLLRFSITGPYYFLVFFFQLMLIAPFLLSWCEFCDNRKGKYIWHLGTVLFLCFCSSIFVRYTYVLPVHGGGQYLFGGTYIILFYLGILFVDLNLFNKTIKQRIIILCVSGFCWISWWLFMCLEKLPFDAWLEPYFGYGFNPPSIQFMIFAIITLFVLYSLFSMLEELRWTWVEKIVEAFTFIGKYTLYIFLYHLMIEDFIVGYLPIICENIRVMRVCVFSSMILVPVVCAWSLKKVKAYYIKATDKKGKIDEKMEINNDCITSVK